ncbi:hypothetical protein DM56_3888 [Burkholderia mallei]|nr:hypothetical protein DO70_4604 [Burkholderia pseudomallei]KGD51870.1 hypothetical protein DP49_3636 [Burkholderia pseudomallei]KOT11012.1 hypothetical protein DM56_3888 [Burkholderia mallei]
MTNSVVPMANALIASASNGRGMKRSGGGRTRRGPCRTASRNLTSAHCPQSEVF